LEGGFDERGKFVHIPLGDIQRMSEYFRRVVIGLFLKKQFINAHLAAGLINWKHSGFSVDHSIRVPVYSIRAREALSQYITRPPLSLKKISIEENGVGPLISFSSDNEFFKGKTETFPVTRLQAKALEKYMGMPAVMFEDQAPTASYENAPIHGGSLWPILIFLHGAHSFENQSFFLLQSLASQGYIVMSVNHPFESLVSEFPDGEVFQVDEAEYRTRMGAGADDTEGLWALFQSIVTKIRDATSMEEKKRLLCDLSRSRLYTGYREFMETRIQDVDAILNQLEILNETEPFRGRMDAARVGILGHSFGGAAAVETAFRRPERVAAAANFDCPQFVWDPERDITLRVPVFFMSSTHTLIGSKPSSMAGVNGAWLGSAAAPAYELVIEGAAHHNFSDLTYIPFLKMTGLIGPIDGARAGAMIEAYTLAFFDRYLKSAASPILDEVPAGWRELTLERRDPRL
jgi:pimeloyl-ACP methyl ester carboxylesterase